MERLGPTDLIEETTAPQFVCDGHRVHGGASRVQRPDGVKDVLMGRPIKVRSVEALFAHRADRVAGQQERTKYGLFGLQVVGRHPARRSPPGITAGGFTTRGTGAAGFNGGPRV